MINCAMCAALGANAHRRSGYVSPDHLTRAYVEDFRAYVIGLRKASKGGPRPISNGNFLDLIVETYRDLDCEIVDRDGREKLLNLKCLMGKSARYWVRDFLFKAREPGASTRLKKATAKRLSCLASILKAADPHAGAFWGVRLANDTLARHAPIRIEDYFGIWRRGHFPIFPQFKPEERWDDNWGRPEEDIEDFPF